MVTNRAGKIPFVVSGQGRKQLKLVWHMQCKSDISSPYYRDLAFVTYMGNFSIGYYVISFGKRDDINSGGKQMPLILVTKKKAFYLKVLQ